MKILVTLKSVPDAEQKLKVIQGKIDTTDTRWQINQFDEYAIEAALRLTEDATRSGSRLGEVIVVSIGSQDMQTQLRTALAMGADRAILVHADAEQLDGHVVADILVRLVKDESPDVVLMGKLASDHEGGEVAQRLAAYLGLPQASFASSLTLEEQGKTMLIGREVDVGTEYKRVPLPAVISVDLRVITPKAVQNGSTDSAYEYPEGARYASLRGIMAAKKKPLIEMTLEQLGVEGKNLVEYVQVDLPAARKSGIKVASATELVRRLHEEAKVI